MASNLETGKAAILKGGREWLLLLVSLLLAFFIWLIHNMSLDYSGFLEYRVEMHTEIEGRAPVSMSDEILIVRGKADGFNILAERVRKHKKILHVQSSGRHFHPSASEKDVFLVNTDEIKGDIIQALGNDVDVEFMVTESLKFVFPEVSSKMVRVVPNYSLSCKSQYMQTSRMTLRPDSVVLYGPTDLIANIDSVMTGSISLSHLDRPAQGMARISPIRGVTFSETQTFYSVEVQRYVEETLEVPVVSSNVPEGKELLIIPSEITVTYRRAFGIKNDYSFLDFNFYVDYHDYLNSIDSKVVPKLLFKPESVFQVSTYPVFVDCIFIDK